VANWLADGLPGRMAKAIETNHDAPKPLLAELGSIRLAELTARLPRWPASYFDLKNPGGA
jgi:hypothetical protein